MRYIYAINFTLALLLTAMLAGSIGYHCGLKHATPAIVTQTAQATPPATTPSKPEDLMGDDPAVNALQRFADTQDPQFRANIYCLIAAHSNHDDTVLGALLVEYAKMRLKQLEGAEENNGIHTAQPGI